MKIIENHMKITKITKITRKSHENHMKIIDITENHTQITKNDNNNIEIFICLIILYIEIIGKSRDQS